MLRRMLRLDHTQHGPAFPMRGDGSRSSLHLPSLTWPPFIRQTDDKLGAHKEKGTCQGYLDILCPARASSLASLGSFCQEDFQLP